jgi:hypothetical protein
MSRRGRSGRTTQTQRRDDPILQRGHEGAHILPAALEVEHHIGYALAGPVIGELATAARVKDREAIRRNQIVHSGRGSGRIERRMFDEPDEFVGRPIMDASRFGFHQRNSRFVVGETFSDAPAHRRALRERQEPIGHRRAIGIHAKLCLQRHGHGA